jgi:hypothetical protein
LPAVEVWGFIWIMVILKVPLIGLLLLVWYAVRSQPEYDDEPSGGDGGSRRPHEPPRRPHRRPRGPHGDDAVHPPPPRVRTVARARQPERDR